MFVAVLIDKSSNCHFVRVKNVHHEADDVSKCVLGSFDPSRPSDAYKRQQTKPSLA